MTYIHMHPEFVYLTNICDVTERVEGPEHGAASCGHNTERGLALGMAKAASFLQSHEAHCCLAAKSYSNLVRPHGL